MGFSLRDLMRREKESRKRSAPSSEETNKDKVQKLSQPEETDSTGAESASVNEARVSEYVNKKEEFPVKNDKFKGSAPEEPVTASASKAEDEGSFAVPRPVPKGKEAEPGPDLQREESQDSVGLEVVEETYDLLEDDDESPSALEEGKADKRPKSETVKESGKFEKLSGETKDEASELFDENRLVYEQLNTAYCSNLDYEHRSILREVGVEGNLDQYDNLESEDEVDQRQNKNVITSSNFGVSSISVSASENLPVGFFDDQNVDAKARGKLTAKEAKEKIKELSKRRSSYLKEAKYIQEKYLESHREQIKLENDQEDQTQAAVELQDKLARIKGDLNLDASNLKVDPERESKVDEILNQYAELDYDDLSWMSRSLV